MMYIMEFPLKALDLNLYEILLQKFYEMKGNIYLNEV